jgi:hypothetical protein
VFPDTQSRCAGRFGTPMRKSITPAALCIRLRKIDTPAALCTRMHKAVALGRCFNHGQYLQLAFGAKFAYFAVRSTRTEQEPPCPFPW